MRGKACEQRLFGTMRGYHVAGRGMPLMMQRYINPTALGKPSWCLTSALIDAHSVDEILNQSDIPRRPRYGSPGENESRGAEGCTSSHTPCMNVLVILN